MRRFPLGWLLVLPAVVLVGACLGTIRPLPGDWEAPRTIPAKAVVVPAAPVAVASVEPADGGVAVPAEDGGMTELAQEQVVDGGATPDPLVVEEALRARMKPPVLCFQDPALCALAVDRFSLSAVRPTEDALDDLSATWQAWQAQWPVASRLLHCETLCAYRPRAGQQCVADLAANGGLEDGALRVKLLDLLDVLGPHGNALALEWLVHGKPEIRREVVRWFSTRAVEDALTAPLLTALNQEPDELAAVDLIRAFRTLLTPAAVPLLTTIARGSPQPSARVAAIEALVDLQGPAVEATLAKINKDDWRVEAAVNAGYRRLEELAEGRDGTLEFGGGLELLTASGAPVGGLAFLDEFKARRSGPLMQPDGVRLTREELDSLLARLIDAGGYGLMVVRSTLAQNCEWKDLPRLVALRRAIHVAKLPEEDTLAYEVTRLMRIVRTHYVLGRPTIWWRAPVVASGD